MTAAKNVREALELYDIALRGTLGCSNGNCVIRRPEGMHTNGRCNCPDDRAKAQRVMRAAQQLRASLSATAAGDAKDAVIGRAFQLVLADSCIRWSANKHTKMFIDLVAQEAGAIAAQESP